MPEPDLKTLNTIVNQKRFIDFVFEAFIQGPQPILQDIRIVSATVPQDFLNIHVPMSLWAGELDSKKKLSRHP